MGTRAKPHRLKILSLHDAQAECSCGKWAWSRTGAATGAEIREAWVKHAEQYGLKLNDYQEIPGQAGICPCCGAELEYGEGVCIEESYGYEVSCPDCKFHGKEWYRMRFDCFSTEGGR